MIFDIYNTLFDNSYAAWVTTFQSLCREQDLSVGPETLYLHWRTSEVETRKWRVNLEVPELSPPFKSYGAIWEKCFYESFEDLGLEANPIAATERVIADMGRRTPYPESLPVVTQLHTWYKTGALSNADNSFLRPLLKTYALPMDTVISSETLEVYKPHPLSFQRVLEVLQVAPQEAIFIGDTLHEDILGAQRAGMHTVLVNWESAHVDTSIVTPDHQVTNLAQLLDILELEEGKSQ